MHAAYALGSYASDESYICAAYTHALATPRILNINVKKTSVL